MISILEPQVPCYDHIYVHKAYKAQEMSKGIHFEHVSKWSYLGDPKIKVTSEGPLLQIKDPFSFIF